MTHDLEKDFEDFFKTPVSKEKFEELEKCWQEFDLDNEEKNEKIFEELNKFLDEHKGDIELSLHQSKSFI